MKARDPVTPMTGASLGALAGVRVVDFTRVLAGPLATLYLADFGADVIKVEEPAGDMTRHIPPIVSPGISAFHLAVNRNKRSVVIDLKTDEGRLAALDLIAGADVLVENFTTSVMQRFGLDYPSLRDRFPSLVYCSVSAYGRTGSHANAPGVDPVIVAETGVLSLGASEGQPPVMHSLPFSDMMTAMNGVIAILAALLARNETGKGQFVETSLYDSAIASLTFKAYEPLLTGNPPTLLGNRTQVPPGGLYATQDGHVWISGSNERGTQKLFREVLGMSDVIDDSRFSSIPNRIENAEKFCAILASVLIGRTSEEWSALLKASGIACGVVRTVQEALKNPLTVERGLVGELDHPAAGKVPYIRSPIRMSGTPIVEPVGAPTLGQHTEEILSGKGRDGLVEDGGLAAS